VPASTMQRRSLSPFCWHQTPTFTFHWPTSKIGLPKLCYSHLWDDSTSFEQRDRHDRMMIWTFYEIFLSNLFCSELITGRNPVGKIVKKTVWRSAFLLNSGLKIQCHIVKNTLLLLFRRFCPLGKNSEPHTYLLIAVFIDFVFIFHSRETRWYQTAQEP